jgi:hypothetical protein
MLAKPGTFYILPSPLPAALGLQDYRCNPPLKSLFLKPSLPLEPHPALFEIIVTQMIVSLCSNHMWKQMFEKRNSWVW